MHQSGSMCPRMGLQALETNGTLLENSLYCSAVDDLPEDFKGLCTFHQKWNIPLENNEEKYGDQRTGHGKNFDREEASKPKVWKLEQMDLSIRLVLVDVFTRKRLHC